MLPACTVAALPKMPFDSLGIQSPRTQHACACTSGAISARTAPLTRKIPVSGLLLARSPTWTPLFDAILQAVSVRTAFPSKVRFTCKLK